MRKVTIGILIVAMLLAVSAPALARSVRYDYGEKTLADAELYKYTGDIKHSTPEKWYTNSREMIRFGTIKPSADTQWVYIYYHANAMQGEKARCYAYINGEWFWPDCYALDGGFAVELTKTMLNKMRGYDNTAILHFFTK